MKNLFKFLCLQAVLISLLLASRGEASEPFLLVSDVDDTFKITNIPNKVKAIKNAIFSKKAFSGMSELYREMARSSVDAGGPDRPFYVLSAGPVILKSRVKALLKKNNFPSPMKIKMRGNLFESTMPYKIRVLTQLSQVSDVPMILVGDDTEKDADAYNEIKKEFPDQVLKVYIRQTVGKKLPEGIVPFYNSFDIALTEYKEGRLTEEQAVAIGKVVLEEKNDQLILPKFASCPGPTKDLKGTEITLIAQLIEARMKQICTDREVVAN